MPPQEKSKSVTLQKRSEFSKTKAEDPDALLGDLIPKELQPEKPQKVNGKVRSTPTDEVDSLLQDLIPSFETPEPVSSEKGLSLKDLFPSVLPGGLPLSVPTGLVKMAGEAARGDVVTPEEAEKMSLGEKFARSVIASSVRINGQLASYLLDQFGANKTAKGVRETTKKLVKAGAIPRKPKDFKFPDDLGDPDWWATRGGEAVPFLLTSIPVALAGEALGVGAATALGLNVSSKIPAVIGFLSGGVTSRIYEGATEAAGTYENLIEQGVDRKKAAKAASTVYDENIKKLTGLDAVQYFLARGAGKVLPKQVQKGFWKFAKNAIAKPLAALSEGVEEIWQDYISNSAEKFAKGESAVDGTSLSGFIKAASKFTPDQQEQFWLGTVMGALFQGLEIFSGGKRSLSEKELRSKLKKTLDEFSQEKAVKQEEPKVPESQPIEQTPAGLSTSQEPPPPTVPPPAQTEQFVPTEKEAAAAPVSAPDIDAELNRLGLGKTTIDLPTGERIIPLSEELRSKIDETKLTKESSALLRTANAEAGEILLDITNIENRSGKFENLSPDRARLKAAKLEAKLDRLEAKLEKELKNSGAILEKTTPTDIGPQLAGIQAAAGLETKPVSTEPTAQPIVEPVAVPNAAEVQSRLDNAVKRVEQLNEQKLVRRQDLPKLAEQRSKIRSLQRDLTQSLKEGRPEERQAALQQVESELIDFERRVDQIDPSLQPAPEEAAARLESLAKEASPEEALLSDLTPPIEELSKAKPLQKRVEVPEPDLGKLTPTSRRIVKAKQRQIDDNISRIDMFRREGNEKKVAELNRKNVSLAKEIEDRIQEAKEKKTVASSRQGKKIKKTELPKEKKRATKEEIKKPVEKEAGKEKVSSKEQPKVQSFDDFSVSRGVPEHPPMFPGLHRLNSSVSKAAKNRAQKEVSRALETWQRKRNELKKEYDQLVKEGKIKQATFEDQLQQAAQSDSDSEQARAARRVLEKRRQRAEAARKSAPNETALRKSIDAVEQAIPKATKEGKKKLRAELKKKKEQLAEITKKAAPKEKPELQKKELATKAEQPAKKPGQKQKVMGVDTVVKETRRIDGVDYELYHEEGGKKGVVRVFDSDSGQVVLLRRFSDFEKAEAEYKKALQSAEPGLATGQKRSQPTETKPAQASLTVSNFREAGKIVDELSSEGVSRQEIATELQKKGYDRFIIDQVIAKPERKPLLVPKEKRGRKAIFKAADEIQNPEQQAQSAKEQAEPITSGRLKAPADRLAKLANFVARAKADYDRGVIEVQNDPDFVSFIKASTKEALEKGKKGRIIINLGPLGKVSFSLRQNADKLSPEALAEINRKVTEFIESGLGRELSPLVIGKDLRMTVFPYTEYKGRPLPKGNLNKKLAELVKRKQILKDRQLAFSGRDRTAGGTKVHDPGLKDQVFEDFANDYLLRKKEGTYKPLRGGTPKRGTAAAILISRSPSDVARDPAVFAQKTKLLQEAKKDDSNYIPGKQSLDIRIGFKSEPAEAVFLDIDPKQAKQVNDAVRRNQKLIQDTLLNVVDDIPVSTSQKANFVSKALEAFQKEYKGAEKLLDFKIVSNPSELPINVPANTAGAVIGNTVFLIESNINNPIHAQRVLFEESISHRGIAAFMGKDFDSLLEDISENFTEQMNDAKARYEDAFRLQGIDPESARGRRILAQEVIAKIANEKLVGKQLSAWQRIVAAVRDWIKKTFPKLDLKYSENDVITLVSKAADAVRRGDFGQLEVSANALLQTPAPTFFSKLLRTTENKLPGKGSPQQYKQVINALARKGEFKQTELGWIGLSEWLDEQKGKLSKQDVLSFIKSNQVEIKEVILGERTELELWKERVDELRNELNKSAERITSTLNSFGAESLELANEIKLHDQIRSELDAVEKSKPEGRDEELTRYHGGAISGIETEIPGGFNYREVLFKTPSTKNIRGFRVKAFYKNGNQAVVRANRLFKSLDDVAAKVAELKKDSAIGRVEVSPAYEIFTSPHFDRSNVFAHARINERIDSEGKKVLFLEEIQSELSQAGRKRGFKPVGDVRKSFTAWLKLKGISLSEAEITQQLAQKDGKEYRAWENAAPEFPFKGKWHEFVFKRLLRYAVDRGVDRIAWTTGSQQVDRYSLSKHISEIHYSGTNLRAYDLDGEEVISTTGVSENELPSIIGKNVSDRLLSQPKRGTLRSLTGTDLKIGDSPSLRNLYDRMLPQFVNKYTKKWNGKVSTTTVSGKSVHSLDITPKMRDAVLSGQPLFSIGGQTKVPVPKSQSLFNLQNSRIEPLSKKMSNRALGQKLENAGDIFRELVTGRSFFYIKEKMDRIQRELNDPKQLTEKLSRTDIEVVNKIKDEFNKLPLKTDLQKLARDISLALADQNVAGAKTALTKFASAFDKESQSYFKLSDSFSIPQDPLLSLNNFEGEKYGKLLDLSRQVRDNLGKNPTRSQWESAMARLLGDAYTQIQPVQDQLWADINGSRIQPVVPSESKSADLPEQNKEAKAPSTARRVAEKYYKKLVRILEERKGSEGTVPEAGKTAARVLRDAIRLSADIRGENHLIVLDAQRAIASRNPLSLNPGAIELSEAVPTGVKGAYFTKGQVLADQLDKFQTVEDVQKFAQSELKTESARKWLVSLFKIFQNVEKHANEAGIEDFIKRFIPVMTAETREALTRPKSQEFKILTDAVAGINDITPKQARSALLRIGKEDILFGGELLKLPSVLRIGNKDFAIVEFHPFQSVEAINAGLSKQIGFRKAGFPVFKNEKGKTAEARMRNGLSRLETEYTQQGGNISDFTDAFDSYFNRPLWERRLPVRSLALRVWKNLFYTTGTELLLFGSGPVQITQPIIVWKTFGSKNFFKGVADTIANLARSGSREKFLNYFRSVEGITTDLFDLYTNEHSKWEDTGRQIRMIGGRVAWGRKWIILWNDLVTANTGRVFADGLVGNNALSEDQIATLKFLEFSDREISAFKSGRLKKGSSFYNEVIRRTRKFTQGTNLSGVERSKFQSLPQLASALQFQSYPVLMTQIATKHFRGVADAVKEKNPAKLRNQTVRLAGFMVGAQAAGMVALLMRNLIKLRPTDRSDENWLEWLFNNWAESMVFGPVLSIHEQIERAKGIEKLPYTFLPQSNLWLDYMRMLLRMDKFRDLRIPLNEIRSTEDVGKFFRGLWEGHYKVISNNSSMDEFVKIFTLSFLWAKQEDPTLKEGIRRVWDYKRKKGIAREGETTGLKKYSETRRELKLFEEAIRRDEDPKKIREIVRRMAKAKVSEQQRMAKEGTKLEFQNPAVALRMQILSRRVLKDFRNKHVHLLPELKKEMGDPKFFSAVQYYDALLEAYANSVYNPNRRRRAGRRR